MRNGLIDQGLIDQGSITTVWSDDFSNLDLTLNLLQLPSKSTQSPVPTKILKIYPTLRFYLGFSYLLGVGWDS